MKKTTVIMGMIHKSVGSMLLPTDTESSKFCSDYVDICPWLGI